MPQKYYKPDIIKENTIQIDNAGFSGDTGNGFIHTTLEQDVVIQRISKDLYAHPSSGIREMYANEARACRTAKVLGSDPCITLRINTYNRSIVLEGTDSMGMSWETFRDVYCVLGRSTNFDGKESGQFGFGRAAYMCISDIMILETYCRDTGEKFAVMGKSGIGFQTGLPEPRMDSFGTRISMTANAEIDFEDVIKMVEKCARLSTIRTTIDVDGDIREIQQGSLETFYDDKTGLGRSIECDVYSKDDIKVAFYHSWSRSDDGGIIQMSGLNPQQAYLCGIPVEYRYEGKYANPICPIVVNVGDERRYKPTPDRERFSNDAVNDITARIDEIVEDYIRSFPDMTLEQYITNPRTLLISNMYGYDCNDLIGANLKDCAKIMRTPVCGSDGGRMGRLRDNVKDANFLISKSLISKEIEAVRGHDDKMCIFRIPRHFHDEMELFSARGILTVREYIKRYGLKLLKRRSARKVVVCSPDRHGYLCRDTYMSDEVPENTVSCNAENFWQLTSKMGDTRYSKIRMGFAKENALGKDNPLTITYDEWYKRLGNHLVHTDKFGVLALHQIRHGSLPVRIQETFVGDIAESEKKILGLEYLESEKILIINADRIGIEHAKLYLDLCGVELKNITVGDLTESDQKILDKVGLDNMDYSMDTHELIFLNAYKKLQFPEVRDVLVSTFCDINNYNYGSRTRNCVESALRLITLESSLKVRLYSQNCSDVET